MIEGEDQIPSGESEVQESSPETPVESTQSQSQDVPEAKQTASDTPFHEHPRFKELVEQKNQFAEQVKSQQERLAQLEQFYQEQQSRQEAAQKKEDAMISRLKGIDPEFGKYAENWEQSRQELESLKQWKQQFEVQQERQSAVGKITSLHAQNSVAPELQELYNSQFEAAYARDPKGFVKNIDSHYKAVHEHMTKMLESQWRAKQESYVKEKKAEAKTPATQTKGQPVKGGKPAEFSTNREEARSQVIKRTMAMLRSSNDI